MSKLDNLRRPTLDNVPEDQRETAKILLDIFNFHMEQVINVMNGNIDYDNMVDNILQIQVSVDSNGTPLSGSRFTAIDGIGGTNVIRAVNLTVPSGYPTTTPFISYERIGEGVYKINDITGLLPNNNYLLTIIVTPI